MHTPGIRSHQLTVLVQYFSMGASLLQSMYILIYNIKI